MCATVSVRMRLFFMSITSLRNVLFCVAAVVNLIGCAVDSGPASQPISGSSGSSPVSRSLADEVTAEVNRYRQQKGVQALPRHRGLDQLARGHAEYLVKNRGTFSLHGKNVSHFGFDGRSLVAREHMGFHSVSENVAASTGGTRGVAQTFRQLWVNSKAHENNMRAAWTHTGIGIAMTDDGTVVAVQLFGSKGMESHYDMMDKFRGF